MLLLNLPSPAATFIALANVLNRPLPLSFYTNDEGGQASAYSLVLQTLAEKSEPLHTHLTKGVKEADPGTYMQAIFASLFTRHLAIDEASRLWDIYVFEGDALLLRAAVALLLRKEMALLGSSTVDDVMKALVGDDSPRTDDSSAAIGVGAADEFIAVVRDAGRTRER